MSSRVNLSLLTQHDRRSWDRKIDDRLGVYSTVGSRTVIPGIISHNGKYRNQSGSGVNDIGGSPVELY